MTVSQFRMMSLGAAGAALAAALAIPALAGPPQFTFSIAVKQGDSFGSHGTVSNINDVFINNNGDWMVDVSLTGGSSTGALIKNGQVWLAVGDTLPPSNNVVSSLTNLLKHLNSHGDVAFRPSLTGTPNSGIYFNTTPLVMNGQISTAPQFSPNTPYIGFFRARVADDGRVFAITSVDDPNIPTTVDRALMWLSRDGKGNLIENVHFKEGDAAPGTGPGITFADFATGADNFAMTPGGDVLFIGTFSGAPTGTTVGLYVNDLLVLRSGDSSPVPGSNFTLGTNNRVHLNSSLDYVALTGIGGATINSLVKGSGGSRGGAEIVQRVGDTAPGLPETINSFGTGYQPHITDAGDVIWYAQLSGDASQNQALFHNGTLLIRKGVTQIEGQTVTTVCGTTSTSNGIGSTVVASPNGRYVITRNVLDAGPRAAVIITFPPATPPCPADITGDNVVNVNDLLAVINAWGPCPSPCPPDIVPPGGDGVVNVNDLLAVINAWGPCPKN